MESIQVWDKVLSTAINLPVVKVDRNDFLRNELALYCDEQQINDILEGKLKTKDVLTKQRIQQLADGCIKFHLTSACAVSAVAGIPGGFAMLATVPADMAQFYGHVLALVQKLLYLYGWPDLRNGDKGIDDGTKHILTVYIGVAFGSLQASEFAKTLAVRLAKETSKRIPRMALTQYAMYNIAKQVGKWIGLKLTKDGVGKTMGKAIPLIGAPISAATTYFTFKPMAKKLKKHLDEQW